LIERQLLLFVASDLKLPLLKAIKNIAEQVQVFLVVCKEVFDVAEVNQLASLLLLVRNLSGGRFNLIFGCGLALL